jgi:hypothetical protein
MVQGDQQLASPHFSGALSAIPPLPLCASFQFIVYLGFLLQGGVSLPRGLCWFVPGVAGGIPCHAWCSPVWSAKCLAGSLELAVVEAPLQPTCFLSVIWCGEAFHGLGLRGVEVFIFIGALFLPSVAPAFQQGFGVTELTLSSSAP